MIGVRYSNRKFRGVKGILRAIRVEASREVGMDRVRVTLSLLSNSILEVMGRDKGSHHCFPSREMEDAVAGARATREPMAIGAYWVMSGVMSGSCNSSDVFSGPSMQRAADNARSITYPKAVFKT